MSEIDLLPPIKLPEGFQFSQTSLQDFSECPRRFKLRYMLELSWPAIESEPALEREQFLERGSRFHRLAQQILSGVPPEAALQAAQEARLREWLENFIEFAGRQGLTAQPWFRAEIELNAPLGKFRIGAKYDLLVRSRRGEWMIFDWKTNGRLPDRQRLLQSLQTRVYPYLLARAGAGLNSGKPDEPDKIELIYWLANFPDETRRFPYSLVQFERDEAFLTGLIEEIAGLKHFPLTPDERRCAYCTYRSLCSRGVQAGLQNEADEETEAGAPGAGFGFDQIGEIAF